MSTVVNTCGICGKVAVQLFETGNEGVYACYKCQPLVPEVTFDNNSNNDADTVTATSTNSDLTCEICNKTFSKNSELSSHLRNHRAEKKYSCTICTKAFTQSNNLRVHLRIHTNERPYKCQVCDKAFTQVTNLNNHIRLHTGERPFVCTEPGCDKAFAQVTNLNQHRKQHTNRRNLPKIFVCNICGEQFSQKSQYLLHKKSEHGKVIIPEVVFECKVCNEGFTSERKLMLHSTEHVMLTDEDQKTAEDDDESIISFKCVFSTCGAVFTSPSQQKEHLLKEHQIKVKSQGRNKPKRSKGRPRSPQSPVFIDANLDHDSESEQWESKAILS